MRRAIGLATEGFFEGVSAGRIVVHPNRTITRLLATDTHHCCGGKIIPFSLHNVDEVLGDLHVNISPAVRAWHWLMPADPAATPKVEVVRTLFR